MEINSFMNNDFTHLKDWGDYQSFNVENKKMLRKLLMDMQNLTSVKSPTSKLRGSR